jgi:transposase InsO family protein
MVGAKAKFEWKKEQQAAFDEMKRVISKETLLAFPNFKKKFHIYTDASNYQLGAVIMQDDRPLAFYSRKMNTAQQRYTTGEQELLSIVEVLKEFRNILLGQDIVVHTDHKNIVYGNLSNDRIARWRLLLEEYSPEYVHVSGKDNVVADALSRLDADFNKIPEYGSEKSSHIGHVCAATVMELTRNESFKMPTKAESLAVAMVTQTDMNEYRFPLLPSLIKSEQLKDKELQNSLSKTPHSFETKVIEGIELTVYNGKIYIPKTLRQRIIAWYHEYLVHPGMDRMEKTLRQTLVWPDLRKDVGRYVRTCRICQLCKGPRKQYGHLPLKTAEPAVPWNRVNVDMIGPLTVRATNGVFQLRALTMIDPATGWFEVKDVKEASATSCMEAMDDTWLSRYPRPEFLGYDGGSEFKSVFDQMRLNYGMKRVQTTAYNPQSNGIIERVHAVLNNCLKTFELEERELDEANPWGPFLSAAAYAIRSTVHTTLEASPAQLVFGRDMLLPITFRANWARIRERRQEEMTRNNRRENQRRIRHEYKVGDKVLLDTPGILPKLRTPRSGPYVVQQVHTNGTVRIQRGAISERVNIRRLTPFFEDNGN